MTWGNIFINTNQNVSLRERRGRKLLRVLRHAPEDYKLELDSKGYVNILDASLQLNITVDNILEIADLDSRRFELNKREKIRARYGHTCKKITPAVLTTPLARYYIRVNLRDTALIRERGIVPKDKFFIRLDHGYGGYKPNTVILTVMTADLRAKGVKMYKNHFVFVEHIPASCLELTGF